jgi:DNA-directed RNA polymerase subunit RPC12/RpoP
MAARVLVCAHCKQTVSVESARRAFVCPRCQTVNSVDVAAQAVGATQPTQSPARTKLCPSCKEAVNAGAVKCPHCGSTIVNPKVTIGCLGVIALVVLAAWINSAVSGGAKYTTQVTPIAATKTVASLQVDVTNTGSSAGTPTCTLNIYASDNSLLGTRPFYPGNIYPGTDNLVSLSISGFMVPLVGHYSADCS